MSKLSKLTYQDIELAGRDGETVRFTGVPIGRSSSHRTEHMHRGPHAPRGTRCSACRWFELTIYRRVKTLPETDIVYFPGLEFVDSARETYDYVVHTVGESTMPGETRLSRVSTTASPFEVIEFLTVRKPHEEPFMTAQSARALAQAAELDEGLREAYINRAVV